MNARHSSVLLALRLTACPTPAATRQPPPEGATPAKQPASAPAPSPPTAAEASPTPTLAAAPEADTPKPEQERHWDFESDVVDATPAGFSPGVGQWIVRQDPKRSRVLSQRERNDNATFNVVLVDGTDIADVDLTVELHALAGKFDRGGGLVWRAQGPKDYYVARYNPLEDNFRVYHVVKGRRSQIGSANLRLDHDAWHKMHVRMQGDHIECWLDGEKHLDVHDGTFTEAGEIGLWTKADAQTDFDDLTMTAVGEAGEAAAK